MQQLELFTESHSLRVRTISRLLWLANSDPPYMHKYRFYAMKEKILARYGHCCGEDFQEITLRCNSCHGTGGLYEPGGCYKCGGDGIYRRYWVRLIRWAIGDYVFHQPAERLDSRPYKVNIKGYVRHEMRGRKCWLACLVLALFFDRQLLRMLLRDWFRERDGRFRWLWVADEWCARLLKSRCECCGKKIWPWSEYRWTCSEECERNVIPF